MANTIKEEVRILHFAASCGKETEYAKFMENRAYNKYVINGVHRPENVGEAVYAHVMSAREVRPATKRAYLDLCWFEDESGIEYFFFPTWEEVEAKVKLA